MMSISYLVSVWYNHDVKYVVQLRHHGDVASMNAILELLSRTVDPHILPLPLVYPIIGERERQMKTGFGIQITRFVPGIMGNISYPSMVHKKKLVLVRKLALAFDALWKIPLPSPRLIGELQATRHGEQIQLKIGPERHHSLGGPFSSVSNFLRAHIRAALSSFRKQQCIEEYKTRYLERVTAFVETGMFNIPPVVELIPVVFLHSDMGLHNIIVSEIDGTDLRAIIDWEFCASAPYACIHPVIESLFRKRAANGFGPEYPHADELRRAFWESIPHWKRWNESEATQVFLEWFRFGLFMKAEWRPDSLPENQKESFWSENVRVVEQFLEKYYS
jgi:hypothetical protein